MKIQIWKAMGHKFYFFPRRLTLKSNPPIYTWLGLVFSN